MIKKELQPDFIKNIREKLELSQREFGAKIGVSGSYIGQIETGKSFLSKEIYKKIINDYGDLLTEKKDTNILIDYYPDVFASCGNGLVHYSPNKIQLEIPKRAFFTRFSSIKTYSMFNAYGDSMEPLIKDKDKIIVEHWNGEQIIDNRPYYFCYKNEIFIKKLVKNINQLLIISENKDYDTIKLQKEEMNDIHIIGQIVGLVRDLR